MVNWTKEQRVKDLKLRVFKNGAGADDAKMQEQLKKEGKYRTPLLFMELPATDPEKYIHTASMYGHFDQQPPITDEWHKDLGSYKPIIRDGKLYDHGDADDGYAIFATIDCIKALQEQKKDYTRIVVLIEGSEESDSPDLRYYIQMLKHDIGNVEFSFSNNICHPCTISGNEK